MPIDDEPWWTLRDTATGEVADARAECSLPGVRCEVCSQTWGIVGVHYPSIDCALIGGIVGASRPVGIADLSDIRARVEAAVGRRDVWLPPGARFGRLRGRLFVSPTPLMLLSPWDLALTSEALDAFRAAGVEVRAFPSILRHRAGANVVVQVVEATPRARLDPDWRPTSSCAACGRQQYEFCPEGEPARPHPVRLTRASLTGLHVARVREWSTRIVVSDAFKRVGERLAPPEIAFEPANVVA